MLIAIRKFFSAISAMSRKNSNIFSASNAPGKRENPCRILMIIQPALPEAN